MSDINKDLMLREIIRIDEEKCDGCGDCVPECPEGAIQIIEGKCRIVSEIFCDGLGACIGYCPEGAITIEKREAEPYDEAKVIKILAAGPAAVLKAHIEHLEDHNAAEHLSTALETLAELGVEIPSKLNIVPAQELVQLDTHNHVETHNQLDTHNHVETHNHVDTHNHVNGDSCPGSAMIDMTREKDNDKSIKETIMQSELRQWPIQLHLVNPQAPYFQNSELVIMCTCGPVANANVHSTYLKGRSIVVACPKLDYTEPYTNKITEIFSTNKTKKAIVVIMEVPCCSGLSKFAYDAARQSGNIGLTVEEHVMGLDGDLKAKNILFKN